MKQTIVLLFIAVLFFSCQQESQQERDERLGSEQLAYARLALDDGQYDAARDTILALRRDHPLAMNARRQAILLLDSVELRAAQDSLAMVDEMSVETEPSKTGRSVDVLPESERLSVKVKFFERKLQEDQKKRK